MVGTAGLKDDGLAELAGRTNVARFVSFGPGTEPPVRHVFVDAGEPAVPGGRPEELVARLLERSGTRTVNVRTFRPDHERGNPFRYGLAGVDDAVAAIRSLAAEGYHVIANETLDVGDGGVSGVRWGGWTEFAPGDTPRCVESPGTAGLASTAADDLLHAVYGVRTPLPDDGPEVRLEFSLHPEPVGLRGERTVAWERGVGTRADRADDGIEWPNRFSRFLGDKAYGLLVGHVLGFAVPRAEVLARDVAPFRFGTPTGTGQVWVRTCPRDFSPGHFSTVRGWTDPFALLALEDPGGDRLGSVLVQEGVAARWSGAAAFADDGGPQVLGVAGEGDRYMSGEVADAALPRSVRLDALALHSQLADAVGPCRVEWVHDGEQAWLVQLNRDHADGGSVSPGDAAAWVAFDPRRGVDALAELLAGLAPGTGVELTRRIGWTSHLGDVLRAAAVPARIRSRKPAADDTAQTRLW